MHRIIIGMCLLLSALSAKGNPSGELTRIKQNFVAAVAPSGQETSGLMKVLMSIVPEQEISDQAVVELHQRYPLDVQKLERYLSALQTDGKWPDIDYADRKRSGWEPKNHVERILELARLYRSERSAYYHSARVEAAIHRALQYWFRARLVCPNWWYNQIGVPKTLGTALLLFEDRLTPDERRAAREAMEVSKFGMTGQNKVWLAGNVLMRALLQGDASLAREARNVIASEIVTGGAEGIQADWSFHQHGAQQQFGNYGLSFLSSMSFYSRLFAGTSLAFDEHQLGILRNLLDEGYRWILWKGKMDISSLGRQLFHHAQVHKALSVAFSAGELGGGLADSCTAVAHRLMAENYGIGRGRVLTGHKHFWQSDYTVHRQPEWMASVKMASSRVVGAEQMNGDNMKGYYLADGATYVYRTGNEYLDIFPLWNWREIPGVTAFQSDAPMPQLTKGYHPGNKASFVGGVSDGQRGMTAMVINRAGIRARKAWVFAANFVLCLGADIRADSNLVVATAVEQCLKEGDLQVLNGHSWTSVRGKQRFTGAEHRFYHHGTGYVLWNLTEGCVARSEHRTGRWHDVMQMYLPRRVEGDVVSLACEHGVSPQGGTYQYLVLPGASRKQIRSFSLSSVRVLRNDEAAQAVYMPTSHVLWATAYRPVSISLPGGDSVDILTPGIYQLRKEGKAWLLHATDPTGRLQELRLKMGSRECVLRVDGKNGRTVSTRF